MRSEEWRNAVESVAEAAMIWVMRKGTPNEADDYKYLEDRIEAFKRVQLAGFKKDFPAAYAKDTEQP